MQAITMDVIRARHSVRHYIDRPIESEKVQAIKQFVNQCNCESGLHMQLVTDEPLAFSTGLFSYGKFQGVSNYLALVGPKGKDFKQSVGYYGQKVVLSMQAMGLNTCWVALTYKKIKDVLVIDNGEELKMVVACGYGRHNGVPHPQKKTAEQLSRDLRTQPGPRPEWFVRGLEAAMMAPTAINQQKFVITLLDNNQVRAEDKFDIFGLAPYDLGIVKCNFELAAGAEHFQWA